MKKNKIFILSSIFLIFISTLNANKMPPFEAIEACKNKTMQEECEFKDRNGISKGICNDKPGVMACAPNRGNNSKPQIYLRKQASTYVSTETKLNSTNGKNKFILEVWADNWVSAFLENKLILEDSVSVKIERSFNSETTIFKSNYPLYINFIIKDYKQNNTGLEYIGQRKQQMGDGGFIMQLTDTSSGKVVAASNKNMKCMVVHKAPLNKSCEKSYSPKAGVFPCDFKSISNPKNWQSSSFDDSTWPYAKEYSKSSVRPKDGYDKINWSKSAKLIWSDDLETDNTILCRLTIKEPKKKVLKNSSLNKNIKIFNYFKSNKVATSQNNNYYHISSDGIPSGDLMVGIKSWQQQVPLPQNYKGNNAWLITKYPKPAQKNLSLSNNFYMGAIGLAADGTPIFNPLNNRGDDAYLAGELDHQGGHSGRADDYHYHTAPTYLNKILGKDKPIAFILDGYPLYGFYEPNGKKVDYSTLDKNRGHTHDNLGYHYHASSKYPYVNQSMYGTVNVLKDKRGDTNFISPQPKTKPLRDSLEPLRGAIITGFKVNKQKTDFSLTYKLKGRTYTLKYHLKNGFWYFYIPNHDGTNKKKRYKAVSNENNRFVHSHNH